ncbi:hypothetical protein U27_02149 [Candidatus Vecturithrix granuli]|uniref:Phosphodiester glycosidase domain-containing protein n=1 Tax=Vecturithrix granuli TaxID=1499967 RepID=A0A0S6W6N3_VECG1|nr:hypothetical protein U27_02149 [Candidatus Vecturithrix granuli]
MRTLRKLTLLLAGMSVFISTSCFFANNFCIAFQVLNRWQVLEPGLELGIFESPQIAEVGDSFIHVLRIDPRFFEFRLLNASSTETQQSLSAKVWCQTYNLTAAINASMYQKDYLTSVSLMRTGDHVNNSYLSKDNAILAFGALTADVPLVKIIDRQCENFEEWRKKYTTFVQSIRMISCHRRNVWRQQPQKWSTALIGTDQQDRVLFIHVRSHYSTHDLINILLQLPIAIERAMYTEGGWEAQLYVRSGAQEYEFVGGSNSGLRLYYNAHPIPNVIGIARREGTAIP